MILVTKEEAEKVRARYPNAGIVRTCKQKSKRHTYYCPEKLTYLQLIADTNPVARELISPKNRRKLFYL